MGGERGARCTVQYSVSSRCLCTFLYNRKQGGDEAGVHPRKYRVLALLVRCRFVSRTQRTRRASTIVTTNSTTTTSAVNTASPVTPRSARHGEGRRGAGVHPEVHGVGPACALPVRLPNTTHKKSQHRPFHQMVLSLMNFREHPPPPLFPRLPAKARAGCAPAEVARVGPACVLSSPDTTHKKSQHKREVYEATSAVYTLLPPTLPRLPASSREASVHPRK